jgi:hypothetical protein
VDIIRIHGPFLEDGCNVRCDTGKRNRLEQRIQVYHKIICEISIVDPGDNQRAKKIIHEIHFNALPHGNGALLCDHTDKTQSYFWANEVFL